MICSLNNHTYRIHKTNTYVQTSTMTACSDNLPSNDGLSSGESCQHWTIHFLANDSKSWCPVISLTGGRLPDITAVFTCSSLVADKRNIQQIRYSAQAGGKWCHHQVSKSINEHLPVIAACCRFGQMLLDSHWEIVTKMIYVTYFHLMWPRPLTWPQNWPFHALALWTIPFQKRSGLRSALRLVNGSIGHPQKDSQ